MIKYTLILCISLWFASAISVTGKTVNNENPAQPTNESSINETLYLYIGTYTNAGSEGIYLADFNVNTGTISTPKAIAKINNPSFQCISADQTQLWSVNESGSGNSEVVGFQISKKDGSLTHIGNYSTVGSGPCFVSYHQPSQTVMAANYNSGNTIRIGVGKNNKGETVTHQHEGSGPNASRQSTPHAHCIKIDLNGKYAYSCDLGADKIYVYNLEESGLNVYKTIKTQSGSGPRHLDFHPDGKAMMVINELNSTIETYLPDEHGCFTKFKSTTKTIPSTFTTNNQCADIHFSHDGKFLFGSNRGHNSIVSYAVNQESMELTLIGWMQEDISWPRNFTISPDGNFILVANQNSDLITVYKVDQTTGILTYTGNKLSLSKPVCLNLMKKSDD